MSDTFCILPWVHLQFNPEGTAKICCRSLGSVTQNNLAMSVEHHTLNELWNSGYMQDIRKKMVEGRHVTECELCYADEARTGGSYRTSSNIKWMGSLESADYQNRLSEIQDQSIQKQFITDELPSYVQLNLGNLCNLQCRMCCSSYSSQIEADPVHSKWAPHLEMNNVGLARWSADALDIGPRPTLGVTTDGFYDFEVYTGKALRWTNGDASLSLRLPHAVKLNSIQIKFHDILLEEKYVTISVNDHILIDRCVLVDNNEISLDISSLALGNRFVLRIESPTSPPLAADKRALGVAVESISLQRSGQTGKRNRASAQTLTRFTDGKPWHDQDAFIYGEVLANPQRFKEFYFTGGEPFLNDRVHKLIDYLIDLDLAKGITLQFNSNCTTLDEALVDKLARFERIDFALSLDGYGQYYDYIRFPGRWSVVSENVKLLLKLPNANLMAVPVIQAYNVMNIVELCKYLDGLGISFSLMPLQGPAHMAISVLPENARRVAVERLREYSSMHCLPARQTTVQALIASIEGSHIENQVAMLREFMLFTNDIDRSRKQTFSAVHGELLDLIRASGFAWSDEGRFAPVPPAMAASFAAA